jgi:hypothetical protein
MGIVAVACILPGCAQKRTPPTAHVAAPTSTGLAAAQSTPAAAPTAEAIVEKKPRWREAAVYIDGKPVGILRPLELPPTLKARTVSLGAGYTATRYTFTDYAASLGVDVKKIRAVHLYGGSRVIPVDGDELRRVQETFTFGFLQGDRGKPQVSWPPKKMKVHSTIDLLSGLAFYVDKEPPHLDGGRLVMPDGSAVGEKMPYAEEESNSGTRIYVDGTFVGAVKRKKLTNDIVVSKADDPVTRFSFAGFESKLGVDVKKAKAVDFIAGDDVIARMPSAGASAATFSIPRHNQGKMLVDVATHEGSKKGEPEKLAKVSAVQVFIKTKPPVRVVADVDDVAAASPEASSSGSGGGGGGADDEEM